MRGRSDAPHKYDPLVRYLQALSPEQASVTLTFAALEALLSFPLPASAWNSGYWGPRVNGRPTAWTHAGFTARLLRYPGAPSVAFQRQHPV